MTHPMTAVEAPAPAVSAESLRALVESYCARLPAALAFREALRVVALRDALARANLGPEATLLDVGCGDGYFWAQLPQDLAARVWGIDIDERELALAGNVLGPAHAIRFDIQTGVPFGRAFDVALGNCSLEHVPDIHAALANIRRALAPGGRLILFVPAFEWTRALATVAFAERRFGNRAAMAVAGLVDGYFQHHHLLPAPVWESALRGVGFTVARTAGLGSREGTRLFERLLPRAIPAHLRKSVSGKYATRASVSEVDAVQAQIAREVDAGLLRDLDDAAPGDVAEYMIEAIVEPALGAVE